MMKLYCAFASLLLFVAVSRKTFCQEIDRNVDSSDNFSDNTDWKREGDRWPTANNESCPVFTQFWRRKVSHFFRLRDVNGDGVITKDDYLKVAERFGEIKTAHPDTKEKLREKILQMQDMMTKNADRGFFITEETMIASLYKQRCQMHDRSAIKRSLFHDFASDSFTVLDENGDDLLDLGEYMRLFYSLCMYDYKTVAKRSFYALDRDGDGFLSRSDYVFAFRDYFFSDDPTSPGTLLFGPFHD